MPPSVLQQVSGSSAQSILVELVGVGGVSQKISISSVSYFASSKYAGFSDSGVHECVCVVIQKKEKPTPFACCSSPTSCLLGIAFFAGKHITVDRQEHQLVIRDAARDTDCKIGGLQLL